MNCKRRWYSCQSDELLAGRRHNTPTFSHFNWELFFVSDAKPLVFFLGLVISNQFDWCKLYNQLQLTPNWRSIRSSSGFNHPSCITVILKNKKNNCNPIWTLASERKQDCSPGCWAGETSSLYTGARLRPGSCSCSDTINRSTNGCKSAAVSWSRGWTQTRC